jgi:hypothetical protein
MVAPLADPLGARAAADPIETHPEDFHAVARRLAAGSLFRPHRGSSVSALTACPVADHSTTMPPSRPTMAMPDMPKIELTMLAGQCLDRRLADRAMLKREVAAWQAARNRAGRGVNWRFTTEDARIKLKHLYPTTQS